MSRYQESRWISIQGDLKRRTQIELHATVRDQDELALLFLELRTVGQFLPLGEDATYRAALANAPFPLPS